MYSFDQVVKGIRDPILIRKEFEPIIGKKLNILRGNNYVEQDWDNLILLDACRYDLFSEINTLDGRLSVFRSNGSSSDEYFKNNFVGGSFGDIVYYSANPHIDNIEASFYDIFRLWETDFDEETGTVLPDDLVETVLDTADQYENKRLIIHMMQPHRPFIGEEGRELEQTGFARQGVTVAPGEVPDIDFWWDRLESGDLDKDTVWRLYRENLEVVLPYVKELIQEITGKTVVSADHGNLFLENGMAGHPSHIHHKKLVRVPWLEVEKPRKEIIEEDANVESKQSHYDSSTKQLEALGYLE